MDAVLDAVQSAGIQTKENSWDADAAIIWSVLWHGRMAANQKVYEQMRMADEKEKTQQKQRLAILTGSVEIYLFQPKKSTGKIGKN